MDYDYQLIKLSERFYRAYPNQDFDQILLKTGRVYTCLLVDTHDGYFICIPYRSSMERGNGFLFRGTERSKKSKSGLDYEKTVIIKNPDYVSDAKAVIDRDEYVKTVRNMDRIVRGVLKYIETYRNHIQGIHRMNEKEFRKRYFYTSLKYFHGELGIDEP